MTVLRDLLQLNFQVLWSTNSPKTVYNIPRACLLNRSPVPAMDLKSNRSGLWRPMLETCCRLRRLCHKHSNNVARHDKTSVKSTVLSCDLSFMSCRSDIMLWLLHIQKLQYMHFQFAHFCCVATYDIIFGVVRYVIKQLFYETAWSILFWNHANDVTSLVKIHREYSPAARILQTKFD